MALRGGRGGYNVACLGTPLGVLLTNRCRTQSRSTLELRTGQVVVEHTDREGGTGAAYPSDLRHFLRAVARDGVWTPAVVRDRGRHLTLRLLWQRPNDPPF